MENDLIFIRKLRNLPSVKMLSPGLCNYPTRVINIDQHGRIFLCLCEAWLPWSVGHVLDFQSIDEIWRHSTAKEIANSQNIGEYKYCDTLYCGIEKQSRQSNEILIYLGFDDSCQLTCPSCRTEKIFDKDYELKYPWIKQIVSWLDLKTNVGAVNILIGAHGDPFASRLYRETIALLAQISTVPPIKFQLKTNGLLLTKYLKELDILDQLSDLEISIDAGTEVTYEQVRRPGRWKNLLENLDFVYELRLNNRPFKVQANFVIQKNNYKEIPNFIDLCNKYSMSANFTLLQDWQTFTYKDHAVHLLTHPEHDQFIKVVTDPAVQPYIGGGLDRWTKS